MDKWSILLAIAGALAIGGTKAIAAEKRPEPVRESHIEAAAEDPLVDFMRRTAYSNYDRAVEGNNPTLDRALRAQFVGEARRQGIPVNTWEGLQRHYENRGKYLFVANAAAEQGLVAYVMLYDLASKERQNVMVDGREVSFTSVVIETPLIRDFVDYQFNGRHKHPSITYRRTVIHNRDVHRKSADVTWDYLSRGRMRNGELEARLREAQWRGLYDECISEHSSIAAAERAFKRRHIEQTIEGVLMNEAYHMSIRGTRMDTNDNEEEIRSSLHGHIHNRSLSQGALIGEVYALFHIPETSMYHQNARTILTEYVQYIQKGQRSGRFRNIRTGGSDLREQVRDIYKLTGDEIKEIARHLYERHCDYVRRPAAREQLSSYSQDGELIQGNVRNPNRLRGHELRARALRR